LNWLNRKLSGKHKVTFDDNTSTRWDVLQCQMLKITFCFTIFIYPSCIPLIPHICRISSVYLFFFVSFLSKFSVIKLWWQNNRYFISDF
jgi:hypothetical protein